MRFSIEPPRVRVNLELEYYKHFEQPMGLLRAELWEGIVTTDKGSWSPGGGGAAHMDVEACCDSPCVGPPNQGFYDRKVIAHGLEPGHSYTIALRLTNRTSP